MTGTDENTFTRSWKILKKYPDGMATQVNLRYINQNVSNLTKQVGAFLSQFDLEEHLGEVVENIINVNTSNILSVDEICYWINSLKCLTNIQKDHIIAKFQVIYIYLPSIPVLYL